MYFTFYAFILYASLHGHKGDDILLSVCDCIISISVLLFLTLLYTSVYLSTEAATGGVLQEKVFLEISQNSLENTGVKVSFLIKLQVEACNFIKKETLAQVFSCEFCENSRNTFFTDHLWVTASVLSRKKNLPHFFDQVTNVYCLLLGTDEFSSISQVYNLR